MRHIWYSFDGYFAGIASKETRHVCEMKQPQISDIGHAVNIRVVVLWLISARVTVRYTYVYILSYALISVWHPQTPRPWCQALRCIRLKVSQCRQEGGCGVTLAANTRTHTQVPATVQWYATIFIEHRLDVTPKQGRCIFIFCCT